MTDAFAAFRAPAPPAPRNAQHSSASNRWFSPAKVVEPGRATLGGFDVDPASEALANETIRARRFISQAEDGLVAPWRLHGQAPVSFWLNPPGGKVDNRSLAGLFWRRVMVERAAGNLSDGIFIAFSVELLQTTQSKDVPGCSEFCVCIPDKRIKFERPGEKALSPTHANAIIYVRGTVDRTATFVEQYKSIGSLSLGSEYIEALRRG